MGNFFSKPYYDKWVEKAPSEIQNWFKKENEFLKKNIEKNSVILDVGCGFGRHLKVLAKFCKKVIGIDNNETMVEKAKRNLKEFTNAKVYLKDAEKIPFENEFFDYVICMTNTFGTFLNKRRKILKEMKRVLKNDGRIIISVYSEKATDARIKGYKKVGLHIQKIENGRFYFKEGHITEQFSKEQLNKTFNSIKLRARITELTPISYICVAVKS